MGWELFVPTRTLIAVKLLTFLNSCQVIDGLTPSPVHLLSWFSLLQPRCDPLWRLGLTLTVIPPLISTLMWRPSLNKLLGWTPYQIWSTICLNGYSCSSINFRAHSYIGMSVSILDGSWACWQADFLPYIGMGIHIPQYFSKLILRTYT